MTPESISPVLRAMWVSAHPERERVTRGSTNQVLLAMLELVRRAQAYATPGSISPVQPAIQRREPRWTRRSGRTPLIDDRRLLKGIPTEGAIRRPGIGWCSSCIRSSPSVWSCLSSSPSTTVCPSERPCPKRKLRRRVASSPQGFGRSYGGLHPPQPCGPGRHSRRETARTTASGLGGGSRFPDI